MNGQAIPGFYYDPEKKKYFKIQSANASRDQPDLKYSAKNIRKKEREERVQSTVDVQIRRARKERVVRHHASSLTQICQEREIGARRRSHYMHGTWPGACMSGVSVRPRKVIDRPSGAPIRLFDFDPISKAVYIVHGDNSIKRRPLHPTNNDLPIPDPDFDVDSYLNNLPRSFEPWEELQRTTSPVSSLTFLPITGALATTTYGSDRAPVVHLSDPERDGPYVGQQFTPKGCIGIYASAARPHSSTRGHSNESAAEMVAVGASSSLLLFTRSWSGEWNTSTPLSNLSTDVLAVDWISQSTVALGCRDGTVRLYDSRSGGSSHILTHPFPVTKIKTADDPTRLIVSGLNDSLHLYDIRAPRLLPRKNHHHYNDEYFQNIYPGGRNVRKRRKMSNVASKNWSQPVFSFAHSNVDDIDLDVAVDARLGLVAAAQHEESDVAVRVSNMWTGKTVKEIPRHGKGRERMRCLKFVGDLDRDGELELWASWEGGISRFTW